MYLYIYLPKISNSTFTKSETLRYFKLVNFKVWGIIFISKYPFSTLLIVNETPLIAIEAFSINDLEGKALICSYGKNLTNHEIYLFYKNSYASKYLFLENHNFKIRTNEKKKILFI